MDDVAFHGVQHRLFNIYMKNNKKDAEVIVITESNF